MVVAGDKVTPTAKVGDKWNRVDLQEASYQSISENVERWLLGFAKLTNQPTIYPDISGWFTN
jgi:hypothetical protein